MDAIIQLLSNPLMWKIILAYWLYSAFCGALTTPTKESSQLYQFFFRFCHLLAGNVNRAAVTFKVPGAAPDSTNGGSNANSASASGV